MSISQALSNAASGLGAVSRQAGLASQNIANALTPGYARRDVSPTLAEAMIARYAAGARGFARFDEAAYRRDYAILGAQRNAKILGIFARLIRRDGKPRYADFFPRVEAHFARDLPHPELAPVARFFLRHFGDRF